MDTSIHERHVTDMVPDAATLIARAEAMIPVLRERAAAGEAGRKIPDATIADFKAAGFFDILKPKRWGGYEMEPNVFFKVQIAIAEGCMSSAWVLGVVGVHPLQMGLFPLKAQEDVWSKDTSVLVSSSYQPVGKVEKADGGFILSGQWSFSSGCQHCDWVFLGALIFPEDGQGPPEYRTFLVPRSDYQIIDTWHTYGLKATGSHDIKVDRAFVPEHRTHKAMDGYLCRNPGQEVNTGDLFKLPWAAIFTPRRLHRFDRRGAGRAEILPRYRQGPRIDQYRHGDQRRPVRAVGCCQYRCRDRRHEDHAVPDLRRDDGRGGPRPRHRRRQAGLL